MVPVRTVPRDEAIPRARSRVGGAWALAACLLLLLGILWSWHNSGRAFHQFWEPVLSSSSPIIVCAAYTPVYLRSEQGTPSKDVYTLVNSGYLGGGDLIAASQISGILGAAKHDFVTRIGESASFQDLSSAPSILVGYSVHFWAPLTGDFRYTIDQNNGMILDRGKPTPWVPHNLTRELHVDDDYAVVVRAFQPQTHETMILVGGSEQYGTQAAAELITNPKLLEDALSKAPANWQNGNLELVLHTKIVNNAPAVPQVVAAHYW